jgi:predicted NBD/HSP70 family sugar kinase
LPANFVPFVEIERIAVLARGGDRTAKTAFREAGTAIGNGLARLISLHGKMPVVFTGPGVRFFDLMRPGIDEGLSASLGVFRSRGRPKCRLRWMRNASSSKAISTTQCRRSTVT